MTDAELRFTILGRMTVRRGDIEITMARPRTQAVLAALLLADGRALPAGRLIDAVWGDEPPERVIGSLRSHIALLRKELEPDRPPRTPTGVIVSVGDGYELRAGRDAVDGLRAESLATEAENARRAGEFEQAQELVDQALGLWRGEPLAGVPGPFAEAQRRRFTELRVGLRESRLALDLELGRGQQAIGELTALSAEFPLRERPRGLLMTALARTGRRADALAVYHEIRRTLVDELGIEPGPELAELHRRILNDQLPVQVTAGPGERSRGEAPIAPTPSAALPIDISDFTGREALLAQLDSRLTPSATAPTVVVITGMGGIGKTTVAVHLAHRLTARYPGGRFYVDLDGVGDHPAEPDAVLGVLLRALDVGEGAIPPGGTERSALLQRLLADRKVLLVLDNAGDAAQLAPLLPTAAGSTALITSRSILAELPGAQLVPVDVLDTGQALTLLARIIGDHRITAEDEAAHRIVDSCGLLPLAVRIIGARLAARPHWSLASVAARLADEGTRLSQLRLGATAVESTFRFSYRQLDGETARAFRLLAVPAAGDLSVAAAAAVLARAETDTEQLCETLVDLGMLQSPQPGRYRYHDLLRLFAIREDEPEAGLAPARLLDFLLATAKNLLRVQCPGFRIDHLAATTHPGTAIPDVARGTGWVGLEQPGITAVIRQIATEYPAHAAAAIDLTLAMAALLDASEYSPHRAQSLRLLIDVTRRSGDRAAEVAARAVLGLLLVMDLDERDEARRVLADSTIATTTDPFILGTVEYDLGIAVFLEGGLDTAATHLAASIDYYRAAADTSLEGMAVASLALCLGESRQWDRCAEAAERALLIVRTHPDHTQPASEFESLALGELSRVTLERDADPERAIDLARQAVAAARARGRRRHEGWALLRLAEAGLRADRLDLAESAADTAVRILTDHAGPAHLAQAMLLHDRVMAAVSPH
ncbi:BTAD domain-containing putative transcriptional regulator [Nocardia sp. NPDC059240]|uniref:AfsR/SARP family transcriptional regulator n=1 Tax=Nocardia sp. NPDC059240 TaxID=3346786 RepID=UPI0036A8D5CE